MLDGESAQPSVHFKRRSSFASTVRKSATDAKEDESIDDPSCINANKLNAHAKSLCINLQNDLGRSKSALRSLSKAEKSLADERKSSRVLETVIKIKQECRVLFTAILEHLQSKTGHHRHHKGSRREIKVECHEDLQHFDEIFGGLGDISTDEHLEMLLDLLTIRDEAMQQICMALIESLSSDIISNEPLPNHCPRHIGKFLTILRTFKGMQRSLRKLELSRDQVEKASEAISMQLLIESQRKQLAESEDRFEQLRMEHKSMLSDHGKQVVLLRLQSAVEELEKDNAALRHDVERLHLQQREGAQERAALADRLHLATAELEASRTAYRKDLLHVRPVIENQVSRLQSEMRTAQVISRGCELSALRESGLLASRAAVANEVETLRNRLELLGKELQTEQRRSERMQVEGARRDRLSQVVAAAELSRREESQLLKTQLATVQTEKQQREKEIESLLIQLADIQETTRRQSSRIVDLEGTEKFLRDRVTILEVEGAARELTLSYLVEEMDRVRSLRRQFMNYETAVSKDPLAHGAASQLRSGGATAALREVLDRSLERPSTAPPPDLKPGPVAALKPGLLSAVKLTIPKQENDASWSGIVEDMSAMRNMLGRWERNVGD